MATVYSLICWGGKTGKTVTLTDAGDVVNLANHGLRDGTPVQFASGTLPSGLSLNTTYYAKSTGTGTATLYTTDALITQVTWTGAGTGPFVLKSKAVIDYMAAYPTRWGDVGSERIYDSLAAYKSARATIASKFDTEYVELGQSFIDAGTVGSFGTTGARTIVASYVNGSRSEAFHHGNYGEGYILRGGVSADLIGVTTYGVQFDGFSLEIAGTGGGVRGFYSNKPGTKIYNCFVYRTTYNAGGAGVSFDAQLCEVLNCVIFGFQSGVYIYSNSYGCLIANNIITGNNAGFGSNLSYLRGLYYNNISIGNVTANWPALTGYESASNNAGLSTDTVWATAGGTTIAIATTDFVDLSGRNCRPASVSSPQVDAGVDFYGRLQTDMAGEEAPNYNNGDAEAVDAGCYEFDHGYGNHPASTTVTFQGVNSGSEIRVYDASANELAGIESCAADPVLTWTVAAGQQRIVIIHPDYKIKEFPYTNVAGSVTLPVQQEVDRWSSNP